jgi:pimeloyl-ACP methyl ester carboxylesterase
MAIAAPKTAEPFPAEATADDYGNPEPDWLRVDWREHRRTIDIDGARVNYVELGPKSRKHLPILFIHGLAGCWQNWLEQLPRFSKRHRVVALDLPGFGASPKPPWEISIPAYGRVVDQFCETLGLTKAIVVGNSMGGFVAAEHAINYPERVDRLVLVSAAGISQTQVRRRPLMAFLGVSTAVTAAAAANARRSVSRPGLRDMAYGLVFRHPNRLRPELLYEQHVNGVNRPGFLPALDALLSYDFRERLPKIDKPTLIVWGTNDLIVPPRDADEFERLIENSRKAIFADTGHVPQMERPARFNRLLEAFIGDDVAEDDLVPRGTPTQAHRPRLITRYERLVVRPDGR